MRETITPEKEVHVMTRPTEKPEKPSTVPISMVMVAITSLLFQLNPPQWYKDIIFSIDPDAKTLTNEHMLLVAITFGIMSATFIATHTAVRYLYKTEKSKRGSGTTQ